MFNYVTVRFVEWAKQKAEQIKMNAHVVWLKFEAFALYEDDSIGNLLCPAVVSDPVMNESECSFLG